MFQRLSILSLALVLLTFFMNGCMFFRLKEDLKAMETKDAIIRGRVSYQPDNPAPLLLLLFTNDGGQKAIADFAVLDHPGLYAFMVPRGRFYLAAFLDENQNMHPDEGEIYGLYGAPDPVLVDRPGMIQDIDIVVDRVIEKDTIDADFWAREMLDKASASAYIKAAGVLADLNEAHFSPAYAQKGLWEPYATLREVGIGLYFLEAYDPDKIPVLFVYGASGHAQNWRMLFERMDRRNFQPWFFNYPSGLDLEFIGGALEGVIKWLHGRYGFDTLFIVAHSMGGLVARYAILQNVYEDEGDYIRLLVTISTPWGGHRAASQGVKYAPAVVPSWRDMVPDSHFIAGLYERPLPATIPHCLFFSYSGRSGIMDENNDGAVTLESQLDYRVQRHVQSLHGFDEDHVEVLYSEDVAETFNTILHDRAEELPNRLLRQLLKGELRFSSESPEVLDREVDRRGRH